MRSTTASAVAAAAVAVGFWASIGLAQADPAPTPSPTPAPATGPAPGPGPKTTIAANGTYNVGSDIAPGTYSSAGPIENSACYWKRTSGDTMVDNAMTKKPQVVTIAPTDTSFTTTDCQPWQLADCSQGCAPTNAGSPSDILGQLGTFLLPRMGSGPPPAGPPPSPAPAG